MQIKNAIVFILVLLTMAGTNVHAQTKPNILLFIADDLSYRALSTYGGKQVKTPNIDRLASEGMKFTGMFTSTAMCSPTRQQILTGLYPVRNGAWPNHSHVYNGVRSMAHHMQDLGYRTAILGKRDFGPDASFPFQFLGGKNGDNGQGQDIDLKPAANYISASKEPWVLVVTPNQPHIPFTRGNAKAYPSKTIAVPEGYANTDETRSSLSKYYAEITYLDSLLGDCLKMIEQSGQASNTLVMFTSEQGGQFPFGKWTCYDDGLKTAFIARWPGHIKAGSVYDELWQYVDVVPTMVEAAGGNPMTLRSGLKSNPVDGRSFYKALLNPSTKGRDYVYGVHTTYGIINGNDNYPIRSIRDHQYLLIHNLNHSETFHNIMTKGGMFQSWLESPSPAERARAQSFIHRPEFELYDVVKDPFQLNNLAASGKYNSVINSLNKELESFMKSQGDEGVKTELNSGSRIPKDGGEE